MSLPCPHPSRALTLATPRPHSQPAARQAAQDGARAPRRVRRVDALRSVHTRLPGRGRVVHRPRRARAQEASTAPHRTPLIPPCAHTPHLPHPPHHTRRIQPAALLHLTLHVSVHYRLHARRTASSRTPTRGRPPRDARAIKHRRCSRLRVSVCAPHCLHPSLPQATPSHKINLIKLGKIVVTYCCWRRARWYCLTHVRLTGSHMHSIFIRQVQALLYLLLAQVHGALLTR